MGRALRTVPTVTRAGNPVAIGQAAPGNGENTAWGRASSEKEQAMLKERERYTTTMVSEEARWFLDAVHHGRMTLAEAREAIGIGRDTEATLRAYVKTLTADERKSMKWPGGIKGFTWITAFSVKDLTFRHRVLRMFERGIAKTGGAGLVPRSGSGCGPEVAAPRPSGQRDHPEERRAT